MKIAAGLRAGAQIRNTEYLKFLRQLGVTHITGFMPDTDICPSARDGYWSEDDLKALAKHYRDNGLTLEAIENFLPRHWYKILMDLPGKEEQLENIKRTVTNMGKAGIKIMGYNFSAGGVIGRHTHPVGRGGSISVGYDPVQYPYDDSPIPRSMAWNTVIDQALTGDYGIISRECMKERLYSFLEEMLPVCADAGVALAAHPEDPPIPMMRSAGRVLITPEDYFEMFRTFDTPYCTAEFCQGTFAEMNIDIYETIEKFASLGKISYVHLRNVRGRIPSYDETLIDDGDIDMARALACYHNNGYHGAIIPDHYPVLSDTPTDHATVALAIGHIRGLMMGAGIPFDE
jgi:mannonate dehydratase